MINTPLRTLKCNNFVPFQRVYFQVSHFDSLNNLSEIKDSYITPEAKEYKSVLIPNDVVLVSKGSRIFAWAYDG